MTASDVLLSVRDLAAQVRGRQVFQGVAFDLKAGHTLGIAGANGAGKTVLLRALVGHIRQTHGSVLIGGRSPQHALRHTPVAYFGGEVTLPGQVRASAWGSLGTDTEVTSDRRRIRALPRSARQLLGLRTALGRHPLALIVLDEPWEGLDPAGVHWLDSTLEAKRDRGAAVVVSTRRLDDLAGRCDKYLFLTSSAPFLFRAQDLDRSGRVSAARLHEVFEVVTNEPTLAFDWSRRSLPPVVTQPP